MIKQIQSILLTKFDNKVTKLSDKYNILESHIRMMVYQKALGYNYKKLFPAIKGRDAGTMQSRMSVWQLIRCLYYCNYFDNGIKIRNEYRFLRGYFRYCKDGGKWQTEEQRIRIWYGK